MSAGLVPNPKANIRPIDSRGDDVANAIAKAT
jgi:hypothetical protein